MYDSSTIKQKITEIDEKMAMCEKEVYEIYCNLRSREGREQTPSLQSMKTTIGSKNNTFADCVNNEFPTPEDFYSMWLRGLIDRCGTTIHYGPNGPYRDILIEMMRYDICKYYIELFLTRNYYRNYKHRKRYKPEFELWEVWFGENPLYWGIMISPVFRNGKWTNDVSEIRRAEYEYWTIGHIMSVGIIVPDNPSPYLFSDLNCFISFYEQIIMRLSHSLYEQDIMTRYLKYVSDSEKPMEIPLLIPEFRFCKDHNEHKYRLDFTILNPYTRQKIGFELSPQSTHMAVTGIRSGKTQKQFNEELRDKWEKEMSKRNEYFSEYGISIITFTDAMLQNIDSCFERISYYLDMRSDDYDDKAKQEERLRRVLDKSI